MLDNRHLMRIFGLCVACALVSLACSNKRGPLTSIVHPTLVGVSPSDFLGDVPCRSSAGAMHLYNARLFDVTDDQPVADFPLPSSSLVPCSKDVTFSFVEPGHRYVALVNGYDRTDIEEQRTGSPNAVDDSGHVVQPRWTTECGRAPLDLEQLGAGGQGGANSDLGAAGAAGAGGDSGMTFGVEGVTSNNTFTVFANHCLPLLDRGPGRPTSVRVQLANALGDLTCGADPDQVFEFTAQMLSGSAEQQRAACDAAVVFSDLEPGIDVSFAVEAYAEGSTTPGWKTDCRARPERGTTINADCDPLAEIPP